MNTLTTQLDGAQESGIAYRLDAADLLGDVKVVLRDYLAATFTTDGSALKLAFSNGQKFLLTVTEVK